MIVVPFEVEHVRRIDLQPAQEGVQALMDPAAWKEAERLERLSYTILDGERVMLCGGAAPIWKGRLSVWALLSKDWTPATFRFAHGVTKRFISLLEFNRLEAHIRTDFENGHRWARALGMRLEYSPMLRFFPDGSSAAMYVLTRE